MRFLKIEDGGDPSLVEWSDNKIPEYAVLSHRWGRDIDEVTFKDWSDGTGRSKPGYNKIISCGKQATKDKLEYFWIDTLCIDKSSSAELSEAINSMYRWYQEAKICYAYLNDVASQESLQTSQWFTRGWTLQELVAPKEVVFFDKDWNSLGSRVDLQEAVKERTKIPTDLLSGAKSLDDFSIAQRMSWAAERETKRVEDRAYCMLGIFEINMPLIYGEGKNAFIRLQEEIMKISEDHSLFAWRSTDDRGGCLATSPDAFSDSGNIIQRDSSGTSNEPMMTSSRGIYLDLPLMGGIWRGRQGFAILNCCEEGSKDNVIAINVKDTSVTRKHFERVCSGKFTKLNLQLFCATEYPVRRICIQKGRIGRVLRTDVSQEPDSITSQGTDTRKTTKDTVSARNPNALLEAVKMEKEDAIWLLLTGGETEINAVSDAKVTALSHAAAIGNEGIVRMLLSRSDILVDPRDSSGQTPLAWAASNGHEAVVQLLLETGRPDVNSKDLNLRTPLWWAAKNGHEAVFNLLLGTGKVNFGAKDKTGQTLLSQAAESGHEAAIKLLLKTNKFDINSKDKYGQTSLSLAAENGHTAVVELLLGTDNIDFRGKYEKGRTSLLQAAKSGHKAVVRLLIEAKKFDINLADTHGRTLLSLAAENGHTAVVELLLRTDGVQVTTKDANDRTPLSWAAANGHDTITKLLLVRMNRYMVESYDKYGETPLSWAATNGHEAVVNTLLRSYYVSVNSKNMAGQTPLILAAKYGHVGFFKALLETGHVNVRSTDSENRTLLSYAAEGGHETLVKLLLEIRKHDVDLRNQKDQTPLWFAAAGGYEGVVKLLLEMGHANIDQKDCDGHTALDMATHNCHQAVAKLIEESTDGMGSKKQKIWGFLMSR